MIALSSASLCATPRESIDACTNAALSGPDFVNSALSFSAVAESARARVSFCNSSNWPTASTPFNASSTVSRRLEEIRAV